MATTHISEAEASADYSGLIARASAGEEIVVEFDTRPAVSIRPAAARHGRPVLECLALAEAHEKELGYSPAMDDDFIVDMQEIVRNRKPGNRSAWD